MRMGRHHYQEDVGQWWYQPPGGGKRREVRPQTCNFCESTFLPTKRTAKYCSHACYAQGRIIAKGHLNENGYRRIPFTPKHLWFGQMGHRRKDGRKSSYVLEHRLVMAEHLGRPLEHYETVHHKNGIKDDNRIENLELRHGQHGMGQSVSDLHAEIARLRSIIEMNGHAVNHSEFGKTRV